MPASHNVNSGTRRLAVLPVTSIVVQAAYLLILVFVPEFKIFGTREAALYSFAAVSLASVVYCTAVAVRQGRRRWLLLPALSAGILVLPFAALAAFACLLGTHPWDSITHAVSPPWSQEPVAAEAHGKIVDSASGEPISGAWVILALQHGDSAIHGSSGGCASGSAVVRTDETGRFAYSTILPSIKRGERRDFNIYAYEPSYVTDVWIPLQPKYVDISLREGVTATAALLPYRQNRGKGAGVYVMTRRTASEWENLLNLSKIWTRACLDADDDRGQSDLLRNLYQRAWEIHCAESSSTPNANFPMNGIFNYFEIALEKIAEHRGLGYDGRSKDRGSARRFYVVNSLFPDIPQFGSMEHQLPVTADQVRRFCDFYSQPLADLVKNKFTVEKEFIVP